MGPISKKKTDIFQSVAGEEVIFRWLPHVLALFWGVAIRTGRVSW